MKGMERVGILVVHLECINITHFGAIKVVQDITITFGALEVLFRMPPNCTVSTDIPH